MTAIKLIRKHIGMKADYSHWPVCYQSLCNDIDTLLNALRSYQHGNSSPDLAQEVLESIAGESVAPRNDGLREAVKWALAILEDVQAVDNSEDLQQIITRLSTALEMDGK